MTYLECFEKAWDRLNEDLLAGRFEPQNERDVQSHLYYHLYRLLKRNRTVLVTTEYRNPRKAEPIDLVILKRTEKGDHGLRLPIQIKTAKSKHKTRRAIEKKITPDIAKLKALIKRAGTGHTREGAEILLFMKGIDRKTRPVLDELVREMQHEKIRFYYSTLSRD